MADGHAEVSRFTENRTNKKLVTVRHAVPYVPQEWRRRLRFETDA